METVAGLRQHIVFGLGSNMGDREAHLRWALERLSQRFGDLEIAGLYRTQAISDVPQDDFLNTVAIGRYPVPQGTSAQQDALRHLLATSRHGNGKPDDGRGPVSDLAP